MQSTFIICMKDFDKKKAATSVVETLLIIDNTYGQNIPYILSNLGVQFLPPTDTRLRNNWQI